MYTPTLVWDQSTLTRFRWLWYDATTFEPYVEETSYENSFIAQHTGSLALQSIVNVFKSLTPNAKNIFVLLVKYHLEHYDQQAYIGKRVAYKSLVLFIKSLPNVYIHIYRQVKYMHKQINIEPLHV